MNKLFLGLTVFLFAGSAFSKVVPTGPCVNNTQQIQVDAGEKNLVGTIYLPTMDTAKKGNDRFRDQTISICQSWHHNGNYTNCNAHDVANAMQRCEQLRSNMINFPETEDRSD